ncbi:MULTISPECIES: dihydrodipicolinate synthase family protein [Pseudoalteromonas]|uniref:Dihydrodipicolinate synthase n=1 Tax=Pseudoalteromonas rubra TaxID=43658 RepID=A0A0L0EQH6_9GAMM|nr:MULTISPECIES: dihydrodipicolinate synthase family protein [Pseudoalteromonas]ALU41733.1 dihydrodipicolinate synthase family protein [Pseudoalteromonas rubra]KNC66651.1 dihydrodipicolinate synthase [Pseudoalteromonas rubra]MDK1313543.1 dihydrodipicolinate synthase family protein [Pseudoalteromonas sp. R96]
MNKVIEGVLPVCLTPFDAAYDIDEEDYRKQIDHVYNAGANGFVIGQVSELLRLNTFERHSLIELAVAQNENRGIVIASTGAESTRNAIDYSLHAQDAGVDCLLLMHPTTTALSEEQMYNYYQEVITRVSIPVMIHHAKSYAKIPLSQENQARLVNEFGQDKVLFKPESSPTPPKLSILRDMSEGKAKIFEGDGGMMLQDCYRRGLAGTIPAADTVEILVCLWSLLKADRVDDARNIAHALSYLMCLMMNSVDCYQTIGKHTLKRLGVFKSDRVRPPLDYIPDQETLSEVDRTFDYIYSLMEQVKWQK